MSIPNLTIIGERINPGFASSKALLAQHDLPGIQKLAVDQVQKGARYLTINVGEEAQTSPDFLIDLIQAVQAVVDVPLSFDSTRQEVQEICLKTYSPAKARGRKPIVNSVSELRLPMLHLFEIQPFRLVLMASERLEGTQELPNRTATEIADTARRLAGRILTNDYGLTPDDLILDVSLCPIATDSEGQVKRAIEAIRLIGADSELRGVHMMVGLSNLGILLPKLAKDGSRLSVKLESAFLTLTMPCGLDTILGTPGRAYEILGEDDFVFRGFLEAIDVDGFETLMRLRQLYWSGEPCCPSRS